MKLGEHVFRPRLILPWLILSLLLASAAPATAQEREAVGVVASTFGEVEVCDSAGECRQAQEGDVIFRGDTITTGSGPKNRVRIRLDDRFANPEAGPSIISMSRGTQLGVNSYVDRGTGEDDRWFWEVIFGSIRSTFKSFSSRRSAMNVKTGTSVCGIRGTTYIVSHDADTGISLVAIQEGLVSCEVGDEEYDVETMEKMTVTAVGEVSVDAMALGEWIALEREILGDLGERGDFAGTWSSTYGKQLVLTQSGDEVSGRYDSDNGEVVFTVTGNRTLDGFWIEDASGVECGSAREGRNYWGRLVLEFDEALSGYVGSWSYCDAEPDRGWFGSRIEPD
jgi:hypothetical protein